MPRMCFHIYVLHSQRQNSDRPVWWKYPNVQAFPARSSRPLRSAAYVPQRNGVNVCGVISCCESRHPTAYPFRTFQNPCLLMDFPEQLVNKDAPSHCSFTRKPLGCLQILHHGCFCITLPIGITRSLSCIVADSHNPAGRLRSSRSAAAISSLTRIPVAYIKLQHGTVPDTLRCVQGPAVSAAGSTLLPTVAISGIRFSNLGRLQCLRDGSSCIDPCSPDTDTETSARIDATFLEIVEECQTLLLHIPADSLPAPVLRNISENP